MLIAQKFRRIFKCCLCNRSRCIFANRALTSNAEEKIAYVKENEEYACGGSLFDDSDYLRHEVVVRRQLSCKSAIETSYYGAKCGQPMICTYCGSTAGAPLEEGDQIDALKRKHKIVRLVTN